MGTPKGEIGAQGGKSAKKKALCAWNSREEFAEAARMAAMGKYSDDMVENFVDYWAEPNQTTGKMRWQDAKYFDMARRLATSERMGYGAPAFVPPGVNTLMEYAKTKGIPEQWAMDFYAHYKGVGWMCGKVKMADWKAKLMGWCNERQAKAAI